MSVVVDERFTRLIGLLELRDIKPMDIHSWRVGDPPAQNAQVQPNGNTQSLMAIRWRQDRESGSSGPGTSSR
jgi:hypothetical protein